VTRARRSRRLSGSAHGRRIERATAAQKTLGFALAPPIQTRMRVCADVFGRACGPDAQHSQFLAGSGQGRMTSSFEALSRPETERPIQAALGLPVDPRERAGLPPAASQCGVFSVRGLT